MNKEQVRDVLAALGPVAKGTLSQVSKPCGRTTCAACRAGRKHKAFLFTYSDGGRRRCLYVAPGLVPALRQALSNGRVIEAVLHESGPRMIRRWRQEAGGSTEVS